MSPTPLSKDFCATLPAGQHSTVGAVLDPPYRMGKRSSFDCALEFLSKTRRGELDSVNQPLTDRNVCPTNLQNRAYSLTSLRLHIYTLHHNLVTAECREKVI